ncbi:hypothetical protein JOM56_013761 [Amanita muscaria]
MSSTFFSQSGITSILYHGYIQVEVIKFFHARAFPTNPRRPSFPPNQPEDTLIPGVHRTHETSTNVRSTVELKPPLQANAVPSISHPTHHQLNRGPTHEKNAQISPVPPKNLQKITHLTVLKPYPKDWLTKRGRYYINESAHHFGCGISYITPPYTIPYLTTALPHQSQRAPTHPDPANDLIAFHLTTFATPNPTSTVDPLSTQVAFLVPNPSLDSTLVQTAG